jgi:hypothetical protein
VDEAAGISADVDGIRAAGELARRQADHVDAMVDYLHRTCRADGGFDGFMKFFHPVYTWVTDFVADGLKQTRQTSLTAHQNFHDTAGEYEQVDRANYDVFARLAHDMGWDDVAPYRPLGSGDDKPGGPLAAATTHGLLENHLPGALGDAQSVALAIDPNLNQDLAGAGHHAGGIAAQHAHAVGDHLAAKQNELGDRAVNALHDKADINGRVERHLVAQANAAHPNDPTAAAEAAQQNLARYHQHQDVGNKVMSGDYSPLANLGGTGPGGHSVGELFNAGQSLYSSGQKFADSASGLVGTATATYDRGVATVRHATDSVGRVADSARDLRDEVSR